MEPMYIYKARVLHVVDGDTFDMEVDMGLQHYHKARFRLLTVDTPEIFGRAAADPVERDRGMQAKQFAIDNLMDKDYIIIQTFKNFPGIFGRWECKIFIDGKCFGEMLTEAGLLKKDTDGI